VGRAFYHSPLEVKNKDVRHTIVQEKGDIAGGKKNRAWKKGGGRQKRGEKNTLAMNDLGTGRVNRKMQFPRHKRRGSSRGSTFNGKRKRRGEFGREELGINIIRLKEAGNRTAKCARISGNRGMTS